MADTARASSMQLLAQDLGDILTALRAAQDTTGHERRRSARLDVQARVEVVPFEDGHLGRAFTCMTRDVAFKGLGLLQSRRAARGSQFVITLPKGGDESMSILCTVMYCRELADGIYNVGATFSRTYESPVQPPASTPPASTATPPAGAEHSVEELNRIRQSILG
jgi:hypothetical protein